MINLKIGQKIQLSVERLGINGEGIASYKGRLVFVPLALPKEEILAEITENARNFSRAKLIKINKKSKERVKPACPIYKDCGGCQLMHLSYQGQLDFKKDLLLQALQKYKPAEFRNYELRQTIGMENPTHYRNKLQYQVRRLTNGSVIAGLYKEGTHHLVNLENCLVTDEKTQEITNRFCQLAEQFNLPIYDERKVGGIRTLMIRRSQKTGEVQINFVSSLPVVIQGNWVPNVDGNRNGKKIQPVRDFDRIITALTGEFTEIQAVAVNYHPKKSSEIYGDRTELVWGNAATITEGVLNYDFELSPRAFYQLNSRQAQVLYQEAVKAIGPKKTDRIIDAYCGVGTIGFALADRVKSVHGMDITPEAIFDARHNAKRLGLKNCHYEIGKAETIIPNWYKSGHRATGLIVDPPRVGLDDELLETIIHYQPEKMVYVSCNVSTLAKDLIILAQYYNVEYIQSVDMFPHTARTEAVVKLKLKSPEELKKVRNRTKFKSTGKRSIRKK